MIALQRVAASAIVALVPPASAAPAPATAPRADRPAAAPAASAAPEITRRTPFTHFGSGPALQLRGDAATASLDFGSRADELVTRATLHLRYAYSPALAPGVSHIKLTLNDEVIGTLAVTAEDAGKPASQDVAIDPRLVAGNNKLTMSFI